MPRTCYSLSRSQESTLGASIKIETIVGEKVAGLRQNSDSGMALCRSDSKIRFSVIDPLSRQLQAFQLRVTLCGKGASEYQRFCLLLFPFVPGHQYTRLPMTGIRELPG